MPDRARNIIFALVALLLVSWVGWRIARAMYLDPRAELAEDIASLRKVVDTWTTALDAAPDRAQRMQDWADRTLGGDRESVDANLRARLNRMAEALGLADPIVSTGAAGSRLSPARRAFPRTGPWRELRDAVDFTELEGSITAHGTLAQVIQLVDQIQSAAWIARINQIALEPDRGGEQFSVSIRLTTLFLPDVPNAQQPAETYDVAHLARFESFITGNPFRIPPKVAVAPDPEPPPPAPVDNTPPPFPYRQWKITGVAATHGVDEAWLRNTANGKALVLQVGQRLGDAVLVAVGPDWARFEHGGEQFTVRPGQNLGHTPPANP
jgi:hypothetical protein